MNLLNLGNVNALNDENKKTFASTKGLPYLNISGIYDAVIASANLKAINVKGQMKNVVNVSFVVDVQHENAVKNAQLWLTLDLPPSNYANHLIDLAFLCGCVSQTGEIVLNQEVKQLEKPLSNGETTITHFPQLEQKKVRVAVARTSKADNGTPYFSIRSFFNASNQTITGNIVVDDISTLNLYLKGYSGFTGAINPTGYDGEVYVELEKGSTWSLTADSYISALTCTQNSIKLNGHKLYVDGKEYSEGKVSQGSEFFIDEASSAEKQETTSGGEASQKLAIPQEIPTEGSNPDEDPHERDGGDPHEKGFQEDSNSPEMDLLLNPDKYENP